MLKRFVILFIAAFCCGCFTLAFGQDTLRSDITTDTTLNAGIHIVSAQEEPDDSIEVRNGATLTLNPGVILKFMSERSLVVQEGSSIIADGDPTNPILFTSNAQNPQAGDWGSIEFNGDANGDAIGTFEFCKIRYGGDTDQGPDHPYGPIVLYEYSDVTVTNCRIHDCLGSAVGIQDQAGQTIALSVTGSTIWNCQNGINIHNLSDGTVFENNYIYGMWSLNEDGTSGHGIFIDGGTSNIVVRNNVIADCASNGITAQYMPPAIYNNTIYDVDSYGIQFIGTEGGIANGYVFKNNLIFDYGTNGIEEDNVFEAAFADISIHHSYIADATGDDQNALGDGIVDGGNNLPSNNELPIICLDNWTTGSSDPSDFDLHISFQSVCIDAGDDGDGVGDDINNTQTDIGAFGGNSVPEDSFYIGIAGQIGDETLDLSAGPYRIVGKALILDDEEFTIDPSDVADDVAIHAMPSAGIKVTDGGTLTLGDVTGTYSLTINAYDETNAWSGIEGILDADGGVNIYATDLVAAQNAVIVTRQGSITAHDLNVEGCGQTGITLNTSGDIELVDCDFIGCGYGIYSSDHSTGATNIGYNGGTITDCGYGIYFYNCTGQDQSVSNIVFDDSNGNGNTTAIWVDGGSTPTITDCNIRESKCTGVIASSGSNFNLGDTDHGNLLYQNGVLEASPVERLELWAYQSTPVLTNNDFIDATYVGELIRYEPTGQNPPDLLLADNYFRSHDGLVGDPPDRYSPWFLGWNEIDPTGARWGENINDDPEGRFTNIALSMEHFELAQSAERNGEYEDAADLYMYVLEHDAIPAAMNGWIRCQMALNVDYEDILEEIEGWVNNESLGNTAYWLRFPLYNRMGDYDLTIAHLDTFIMNAESETDSLIGSINQLSAYYQMALAGMDEDGGMKVMPNTHRVGELNLPKLGVYESNIPLSREDYFDKLSHLMQGFNSIGAEPADRNSSVPEVFALDAVYPNPFNPVTTVPFALPKAADVRIRVFDLLGREVATIAERKYAAGRHQATWQGRDNRGMEVAAGMYFIRMEAGDFIATRKALLLK